MIHVVLCFVVLFVLQCHILLTHDEGIYVRKDGSDGYLKDRAKIVSGFHMWKQALGQGDRNTVTELN